MGTLLAPAVLGGLITMSWWGALTGFFWAILVRVALLHHVTWSVNSICHMIGNRPFDARDKSANFWSLAIASMGESWHNSHHADPTCARHGVQQGQVDISARLVWVLEKLGWATQVRWPRPERIARKLKTATGNKPRTVRKGRSAIVTTTSPGDRQVTAAELFSHPSVQPSPDLEQSSTAHLISYQNLFREPANPRRRRAPSPALPGPESTVPSRSPFNQTPPDAVDGHHPTGTESEAPPRQR